MLSLVQLRDACALRHYICPVLRLGNAKYTLSHAHSRSTDSSNRSESSIIMWLATVRPTYKTSVPAYYAHDKHYHIAIAIYPCFATSPVPSRMNPSMLRSDRTILATFDRDYGGRMDPDPGRRGRETGTVKACSAGGDF